MPCLSCLAATDNIYVLAGRNLASARAAFSRAQRETQESFARYTACLDAEAQARQQLSMLEERRDALSKLSTRIPALLLLIPYSGIASRELPQRLHGLYVVQLMKPLYYSRRSPPAPSGSNKQSPLVDDIQNTLERSDSRASTSQSHDEVMNTM